MLPKGGRLHETEGRRFRGVSQEVSALVQQKSWPLKMVATEKQLSLPGQAEDE